MQNNDPTSYSSTASHPPVPSDKAYIPGFSLLPLIIDLDQVLHLFTSLHADRARGESVRLVCALCLHKKIGTFDLYK